MKAREIIDAAKLAVFGWTAYQVASFFGMVPNRTENKGEQNSQDALSNVGKIGAAFDNNYVNSIQLDASQLQLVQNNLAALVNKIYYAWGTMWDAPQDVKTAYLQVNSIAQASLVARGLMEKGNAAGYNFTNGLEVLKEFLNEEELQLYVYEALKTKNYKP